MHWLPQLMGLRKLPMIMCLSPVGTKPLNGRFRKVNSPKPSPIQQENWLPHRSGSLRATRARRVGTGY